MVSLLESCGQLKLASYLRSAPVEVQNSICAQLETFDVRAFCDMLQSCSQHTFIPHGTENSHPSEVVPFAKTQNHEIQKIGEEAIRRGELAFFVVAGGQGSRLGFEHPKGMFPAAPLTGKSLFQIHMEKALAFGSLYGFDPLFLVMTSPGNHSETLEFLRENSWFGLKEENVFLFSQAELPAVNDSGDFILVACDKLFMAPDGHGGSLAALARSGVLDIVEKRGVRYLSYFQIDNPMVRLCDAGYLGMHIHKCAEVSTKVIAKRDALEKLGNPITIGDRARIVEYSDFPEADARKTKSDGQLLHSHGSIGIHLFSVEFVRQLTTGELRLPFHIAKKSIGQFNVENRHNEVVSGRKFEQFVFDAIPLAGKAIFVETHRHTEFAPLKNKDGEDSVDSCKRMQSELFKSWFERAGFAAAHVRRVEVSPLFACIENQFAAKIAEMFKKLPFEIYLG